MVAKKYEVEMNAKEAMNHAIGGVKVRKKGWGLMQFVHFDQNGNLVNNNGETVGISLHGEWELYEESHKFSDLFVVLKDDEYAVRVNSGQSFCYVKTGGYLKKVSTEDFQDFVETPFLSQEDLDGTYLIKKKPTKKSKCDHNISETDESRPICH